MINRNDRHHDFLKNGKGRRLLALLLSLMLLISSTGLTAFAEDGEIISDPATVPVTDPAEETPPPQEDPDTPSEEPGQSADPDVTPDLSEETTEMPADGTTETPAEDTTETPTEGTTETPTEGTTETPSEGATEVPAEETTDQPEEETTDEPILYSAGILEAETAGARVLLEYPAEAQIPENVTLTLATAQGTELYAALKSVSRQIRNEGDETWSRQVAEDGYQFYTLSITDAEGNAIQPTAGVTLIYENPESPEGVEYYLTGSDEHPLTISGGTIVIDNYAMDPFGYVSVEKTQIGNVTLTYTTQDYKVTAVYGPEAALPADTQLNVREIMPGTEEYAQCSGMTEEAMNQDWSEVTLQRYFDIIFVSGGESREPSADVDVQILFRSSIRLTEEDDLQAVHIQNDEATVIESGTDSNASARYKDEAIDTVSFTSDSFSIYGVVRTKKITKKVLAANGDTYEIQVSYGPEAEIPEDAELKVVEILEGSDLWEAYRKQTAVALGSDDVRMPGLFDITLISGEEGNPVNLQAPISVSVTLDKAETDKEIQVVHFTEDLPEELITPVTGGTDGEQTEVQPLAEEDIIQSQPITDAATEGNTVTFQTEGFSVYAFAYTVDFEYTDENGETYAWSFPGRGSYPLTDILAQINHPDESITGASLSLLEGEDHEGALYLTADESTTPATYTLNSDVAFSDTYELTIQTEDKAYVLSVTDSQETPLVINVKFKDENGNEEIPTINGYLAVYASFVKDEKTYYRVLWPTWDQSTVTLSVTDQFGTGGNTGDGGDKADYTSGTDVTVKLLYNSKDQNLMQDKDIKAETTQIEDNSNEMGYTFSFGELSNNELTITATKNQPYHVKLRFQDEHYNAVVPNDISGNYYVYASVSGLKSDGSTGKYYAVSGPVDFSVDSELDLSFLRMRLNNQFDRYYEHGQNVTVRLVKAENEYFINGDSGELYNNTNVLTSGDTVGSYEITSVFTDQQEGETVYTLRKVSPYRYSVAGFETDGTTPASISLSGSGMTDNWYLVSRLTKSRGNTGISYYAVAPIALNGNGATAITGTFEQFYQDGNSNGNTEVFVNGDTVESRLIHMSESGKSNQEIAAIFAQQNNSITAANRYFTGGDGVYTYTLKIGDYSGAADVKLVQSSAPTVTVRYLGTDGVTGTTGLLEADEHYYLYAWLNENPEYGYLTELNKDNETETHTISVFAHKDNDSQKLYLTGNNTYTVGIIKGQSTLANAYNSRSNVYEQGSIIGCATIDLSDANGSASKSAAEISLTKIPSITISSSIYSDPASETPSADSSLTKHYYLLFSEAAQYTNYYALQKLDVSSNASSTYTIDYLTAADETGRYYHLPSKPVTVQLIASDKDNLTINEAINSNSKTVSGGITGEFYSVQISQEGNQFDLTLRKLDPSAEGTSHQASILFYDYDKTSIAAVSPTLGSTEGNDKDHAYYVLATLNMKGSKQVAAYQIAEMDISDSDGQMDLSLDSRYKLISANGTDVTHTEQITHDSGWTETANVVTTVPYDPALYDVKIRMYHRSTLPNNYNEAIDNGAGDLIPGYDFMSNETVEDQERTEIKLHKAYQKDYKVQLIFDASSAGISQSSDCLYMLVRMEHRTTGVEYALIPLGDIAEGTVTRDYAAFTWYRQNNGNWEQASVSLTGNETMTVRMIKASAGSLSVSDAVSGTNCRICPEGSLVKTYLVSYDLEQTQVDENNQFTHITDYVKLTRLNSSSDYSFTDILGQGVYYGINANVFDQTIHIQSNFAVNNYVGRGAPIEADLASEAGAFIAANITGTGKIFIGTSHSGDVLLYVNEEQADALQDPRDFVYTFTMPRTDLANEVNAILSHGAAVSNALIAHPDTFAITEFGNNYVEIDTIDFPENSTIYLDGDSIRQYLSSASGLRLTKRPGQMIVFNFESSEQLTLGKFNFRYDRNAVWYETDSPTGHSAENEIVDEMAKHVVWNVHNATKVDIVIGTGMFLIPNNSAKVNVGGTSSGWIITGGTVTNTGGEWHSVYGELPSISKTNLNVGKTVDGKMPNGSQIFNFTVEHLIKGSDTTNWEMIGSFQNTNGSLLVENITQMQEGWNIYRITESEEIPEATALTGEYTVDDRRIYAAVQYVKKTAAGGNTAWIATTPVYYIEDNSGDVLFGDTAWTPSAISLAEAFGTGGTIRLSRQNRPAFENVTKKDRISVVKVVEGTTDNTKEFRFTLKVEVRDTNNDSFTPWLGTRDVSGEEAFTIQITGPGSTMLEPVHVYAQDEAGYDTAEYKLNANGEVTFTLKAGQSAGFNGLPELHRYTVTENNPSEHAGYALQEGQEVSRTRVLNSLRESSKEIFTNVYTSSGNVTLSGTKRLVNANDNSKSRPLTANQFGFELKQGDELLQKKYNDTDGQIAFETINYTQEDMIDATDNGDGSRTKTIVYTVHEIDGDAGIDNTGITKDSDKTITVTLTDDGQGHIAVSQSEDDLKVSFINTYTNSTTETIEGTKILIGRNMAEGEFSFTATLTRIDGQDVADSTDTSGTDKTLMTVTNAAATATEAEGILTATDHFSFEEITFTKPGTYVYTVTEDEPLPTNVTKRTGAESYTATVTVTEEKDVLTATVAYDPAGKTIINDWTGNSTGLTVQKTWVGNAPKDASIDVVIKRYKLVEQTPEYGTLTINDSFSGLDAGDTYTVSYTVDGETKTFPIDVEVGSHVIQKTVSGYNEDKYTATNTSETRTVTVTTSGETVQFSGTVFTKRTGKLIISDSVDTSGLDEGDRTSVVINYQIGATAVSDNETLPVGTYTIEKTVTGYDKETYNATNANESVNVNITKDGGTATFKQTTFAKTSTGGESHTIKLKVINAPQSGVTEWYSNVYNLYVNSSAVTIPSTNNAYRANWSSDYSWTSEIDSNSSVEFYYELGSNSQSITVESITGINGFTYTPNQWGKCGSGTISFDAGDNDVTIVISFGVNNISSNQFRFGNSSIIRTIYRMIASNAVSDANPNALTAQANVTTTTIEATNNNTNPSYEGYNLIADDEWSKTVMLSSGNWSSSLSNLPVEDGEGNQYVYYIESVTEEGVPAGTAVTFTQDGGYKQVVRGQDGNRVLSLTDTVPTTGMSVIKSWDDNDNAAGIRPASITVHLKADGTVLKDAVLNEDNSWSVTWDDLPIYNESGNLVTYTISEDEITNYRLTSKTYDPGTCTFTLVNTPSSGDLEVEKIVQTGDQDKDFPITVTLSDSTINGNYGEMDFTNGVAYFTLKHGEKATAEGLPANITYTVAESVPAGYSATYTNATGTIMSGTKVTAKVTNNYSASGFVPFKAKKILDGGTLAGGEFTFALTEYTDDTFATVKSEGGVTLTGTNNSDGDVFFESVPLSSTATRYFTITETNRTDGTILYDEHVQKITVTVADNGAGTLIPTKSYNPGRAEELSAGDYDASFTNAREYVDIDVSKIWINADGTDVTETILNASVVFTLEKSTDGENWTVVDPTKTLSVTDTSMNTAGWTAHWTNLPKYENNNEVQYRVKESAATVNGEAALMPEEKTHVFTSGEFVKVEGTDHARASTSFTNTLPATSIRVNKLWLEDGEAIRWPDEIVSITVGLYQNGKPANETVDGTTIQKVITFTEDSTDEDRTFGNLPKYDASGTLISYSVQEEYVRTAAGADVDVADGRIIINGINTWTVKNGAVSDGAANITNTKVKTSFDILKVNGKDVTQTLTGAEFKLKKLGGEDRDEDGYSTVTGYEVIEVDDNGHASITGLTDGTYRLYETKSPSGYTAFFGAIEFTIRNGEISYTDTQYVTYAKNGSAPGTFTVRNYPGAVLPATGGSGTLLYTLAGLALMILAGTLLMGRKRKHNR